LAFAANFKDCLKYQTWEEAMARDREAQIRARAHEIWEKEGRPVGEEHRHWDQASREIDAGEAEKGGKKTSTRKTASAAKAPKTGTKRAAAGARSSGAAKTARGKKPS
jgi:Protein of unknown function (DUF2934)